jgi:hypothetical protein
MSTDYLIVLTSLGRKLATKHISQVEGKWKVEPYGRGEWFSAHAVPVHDIGSLGQALAELERDAFSFVVRGVMIPGTDPDRCRRLLYPQLEDGLEVPATFEPCARRWLGIDFDDLPTPVWDPVQLARRREAIRRDLEDHGLEPVNADLDPAPIDPARDWTLVCHAAIATLPPEFHGISCWWQMTSSAGIKPGIRLRLWFWLDQPVSDAEAKRWVADSPVDLALYNPIQAHYIAAPIFDPPSLDPVPRRSGWFWRCANVVAVLELPEPAPPPRPEWRPREGATTGARAQRYADAALQAVANAQPGQQHNTLRNVALRLFSLAAIGELDPARVRDELIGIGRARGWPERRVLDAIACTTARAYSNPQAPKGW